MICDLSKIPSTCLVTLYNGAYGDPWGCILEEKIQGRTIKSSAGGITAQGAVDEAVRLFTGDGR